jgi:hypothetical protein
VRFREGKLAHEHIYWDQASVLKQIGLLTDPALTVFGAESAYKVRGGGCDSATITLGLWRPTKNAALRRKSSA